MFFDGRKMHKDKNIHERRQIQRTMSLANLMASNSSLECSFENLGFDTTIVAHDGES